MTKLVKLSDVEEMINGRIEQLRKPSFPSEKTIWWVFHLKKLLSSLSSLPTQDSKKLALDFAEWYHNGLTNAERKSVEEEFERFINLPPTN